MVGKARGHGRRQTDGSPGGKLRRLRGTLVATAALVGAGAAHAQVPPPVAPTREQVERPVPPRTEPNAARLEVEGGVERAPCARARPE